MSAEQGDSVRELTPAHNLNKQTNKQYSLPNFCYLEVKNVLINNGKVLFWIWYNLSLLTENVKFSKIARIFVFHPGDKNSLDLDSGGPKVYPQFFVWKSEVFFFKGSLITPPSTDTPNFIFVIKQGGLGKTLEVYT